MAPASAKALQSSLSKLQIAQNSKATPKIKKRAPVESWEDEADEESSDTETEEGQSTPTRSESSISAPAPPPPTPSSPSFSADHTSARSPYRTFPPYGLDGSAIDSNSSSGTSSPSSRGNGGGEEKRPEKSTAVASRLIAAGIGQKAPKRTKEQREYDQAVKVQEKKKRDQAREEEQRKKDAKEKAMKDVWGD